MSKLFRSTWSRVIGAAVGAVLVAFLMVSVAPQPKEAVGQTVPVEDLVDVDVSFDNGCLTISISVAGVSRVDRQICFPIFGFF